MKAPRKIAPESARKARSESEERKRKAAVVSLNSASESHPATSGKRMRPENGRTTSLIFPSAILM
ncbi:MAG: hypothetical protein A2901_04760 [Elusimicrobia bacterium RIFCSPLOWO2_01_FULL_54_10]|nr:MAG: hypothetical protein A2901_04760 [Elusimicrobia bacterium RIFCSPLOWO2_01_FULL_54_10]